MRYAAAEKLEIIRLVEQSSLSVRRPLALPLNHTAVRRVSFTSATSRKGGSTFNRR